MPSVEVDASESDAGSPDSRLPETEVLLAVLGIALLAGALGFGVGGAVYGPGENEEIVQVANSTPDKEPFGSAEELGEPDVGDVDVEEVERLVVEHTNRVRAENGLEEVERASNLSDAARDHSVNMSEVGYVGHVNPANETPEDRYTELCGDRRSDLGEFEASENAAVVWYRVLFESSFSEEPVLLVSEEDLARGLVEEWLASEEHRENLLAEGWRSMGVGVAPGEDGAVFGTQAFCSAG
ncbi:MAG: CAP domain-containing protein [Halobacteriales archaeon]